MVCFTPLSAAQSTILSVLVFLHTLEGHNRQVSFRLSVHFSSTVNNWSYVTVAAVSIPEVLQAAATVQV